MENIKKLMKAKGLTQKKLAELSDISEPQMSLIISGKRKPSFEVALKIAEALDCEFSDLVSTRTNRPSIAGNYVTFPVIGEVAAGYDHFGEEDWTNGEIDIPETWLHGKSRDEFFVLRVVGDSMYPIYQDGDIVLVQKQNVLDHNGQIAVVRYDSVNSTLKRIEQGKDFVKLCPINPQVPPMVIRGDRQCCVEGIPKMLIRRIE